MREVLWLADETCPGSHRALGILGGNVSWSRPSDLNRDQTDFESVASASWARARLAESEGIEPLGFQPTPVFGTGCRPFSGTLRVAERPGVEPGRVYNPNCLAGSLRTSRTSPYGDDEVRLEQGMGNILA